MSLFPQAQSKPQKFLISNDEVFHKYCKKGSNADIIVFNTYGEYMHYVRKVTSGYLKQYYVFCGIKILVTHIVWTVSFGVWGTYIADRGSQFSITTTYVVSFKSR